MDGFTIENGVLTHYTGEEKHVIVPDGVTEIGEYAFFMCENLEVLEICEGVEKICENAVSDCENLKKVIIPASIKDMELAFYECKGIEEVELREGLAEISQSTFWYCGDLKKVIFPKSLKKIGAGAFNGSAIASLRIPDGIEELGDYAFINCKMLQTLDTGSGLKIIPVNAFENCTALKSVIIGESVETIEEKAFAKCISLEKAVFIDTYYWFDYNVQSQITAAFTQAQIRDTVWAANLLVNSSCNVIYKDDGLFCVKLMSLAPFKKGMEKGKVVRNRVIANATLFYDFTIFEYHLRSDFRRLFNRIKVLFNTVSKII